MPVCPGQLGDGQAGDFDVVEGGVAAALPGRSSPATVSPVLSRPKPAKLALLLPALRAVVEEKLALSWSPEQISGWLQRRFPGESAMQLSHEATYLSLFDPRRRQAINRKLTQRSRAALPMRQPRAARRPSCWGIIRDMVSISQRPAEVEDRTVPGHGEGDLVTGSRPSAIATLVERTTRYTAVVALPDGIKAEQVTPHPIRTRGSIPRSPRSTALSPRTTTWPEPCQASRASHDPFDPYLGQTPYAGARDPWITPPSRGWSAVAGPPRRPAMIDAGGLGSGVRWVLGGGAVIEVGQQGAFSVNCVGMERQPFPLSFSIREAEGLWQVSAGAAQAGELVDLLVAVANDAVAVVSLETNSYLDEDWHPLRPSLIAAELGVPCTVHSLGSWASGTYGLAEEFLVMDRELLPRLLDGTWSPYELTLIDVPADVTTEQLDELALVLGTTDVDEPLLSRLGDSRVWFSGHDDCYVLLETRDPALPAAVLARLLTLLAGSALAELAELAEEPLSHVPEPGPWLPEQLIATAPHWIGALGNVTEDLVTIGLAALPDRWQLGVSFPQQADLTATLDQRHGTWRITPAE
nr:IS30 family transposase [Streptomyces cinnamoneus]